MDHPKLSEQVKERAAECAISVTSVWELVMLLQRGRLDSGFDSVDTPKRWLERYPFKVLDLDYDSVLLSRTLHFEHDDPADRFIAATAFRHKASLATNDARLQGLSWLNTLA